MRDISELKYIIALPLLSGVGLRIARQLIEYFGSAKAVFEASENDFLCIPNIHSHTIDTIFNSKQTALKRAEKELEFIERNDISTYYFEDSDYPFRLRECLDAPLLLYGKGTLELNKGKFLSVVGTRMPTDNGKQICKQIVTKLAQNTDEITIISGLAYGIDVTAHRAAIAAGIPTIIIPGHGLDRIYPNVHRSVAVDALSNGGLITEYLSCTQPDRQNFIARNRIIAGMADATLVVESRCKGGSLITADMANGYSREVFAVPGRITDTNAAGCNNLIKQQKAALVESAEDIIEFMQWNTKKTSQSLQTEMFIELNDDEQLLLKMLRDAEDGLHINIITMETGKPYSLIISTLTMMELRGIVRSLPGNIYKAAK